MLAGLRPDHVLDREPYVDEIAVAGDVDLFEVAQQRWAVVPGGHVGLGDDVVAVERRQRDGRHVVDVEPRRELVEVVADLLEPLAVPVDEVHLVDGQHDVLDAQQRGQERVAPRLFQQPVPCVDEHDGQLRGRRAGDHVARVLQVTGRVGDDELALRRGEVAVGDVDRDALFTLGA